jgi:hypothetical protein
MLDNTSIRSSCNDPNVGRVSDLNQCSLYGLLELRLKTKVSYATVHGYDQLGKFQLPVVLEKFDYILRFGVER